MDRTYKSSVGALFRNFLSVLAATVLIMFFVVGGGAVLLDKWYIVDKEDVIATNALIVYGIIALAFSFYFSFIRHNITVQVTDQEVSLSKGGKVYLTLSKSEYHFTSYVHRTVSQGGIYTSRYLRAFSKETSRYKDYRLYFSKKQFEEFIAVATSLNEEVK